MNCPACGADNPLDQRFCATCGAIVPEPAPVAGDGPPAAVPEQHLGILIRFAALLLDIVILAAIILPLGFITGFAIFKLWVIIIPYIVPYFVLFTAIKGQTPGKMALQIQVLKQDGHVPGLGTAAVREIIGKTLPILFLPLLLGHLWAAFDQHKQSLFDKMVSTYVVRKS